jgi:molecular chaperone HscB
VKSHTHYHLFPQTLPSGPPPHGPFTPDLRQLRKEFLQLQASAHPDRHPEERKAYAQALSARINEAYKTLSSPLLRAQYLLSLRGDHSHSDDATQLGDGKGDQELLLEVLELRERIEDAETEAEVEGMRAENEERLAESVKALEEAFARDDLEAARREAVRLRYWVNVGDTLREWERGKPALLQH